MLSLLLVIAPISLLDSTSMLTLCMVPLSAILAVLGLMLVADRIGWFFGNPLLPVGSV